MSQPEKWMLRVTPLEGTLGDTRHVAVPGRDIALEVWLCANGFTPGQYRIELLPMAENEHTAKAARNRLRREGPLADSVTITPDHAAAAMEQRAAVAQTDEKREASKSARLANLAGGNRATAARDPEVQNLVKAAEMARAETDKVMAEIALRKARRELARESEDATKAPSGSPAWLEAIVPMASMLFEKFLASSERREAMLARVLEDGSRGAAPVPVYQEPAETRAQGITLDTLTTILPAVKDLFKFVRDLGGDSDGGGGGERSTLSEIADLVKNLLPPPGSAPAAPQPRRAPRLAQRPPENDPVMLGKIRVLNWLQKVQREASVRSDPEWAAEVLALSEQPPAPFGSLPEEFQALVLTNSVESVIAGLAQWVPPAAFTALQNAMSGSVQAKQWLTAFVEAIQNGLGDDESDEEADDGEDVGEEATGDVFDAHSENHSTDDHA